MLAADTITPALAASSPNATASATKQGSTDGSSLLDMRLFFARTAHRPDSRLRIDMFHCGWLCDNNLRGNFRGEGEFDRSSGGAHCCTHNSAARYIFSFLRMRD